MYIAQRRSRRLATPRATTRPTSRQASPRSGFRSLSRRAARSLGEEQPASANVDYLEDVLARDAAGQHQEDQAEHGEAAVPHLSRGREPSLAHVRGEEAIRLLVRLALEQRERIAQYLRSESRRGADSQGVDVGNHDDRPLVGDVHAKA